MTQPDWRGGTWATLTKAQRGAAYDNNTAVANSAQLIERRNAAAEADANHHLCQ